jgi:hypothetical protein
MSGPQGEPQGGQGSGQGGDGGNAQGQQDQQGTTPPQGGQGSQQGQQGHGSNLLTQDQVDAIVRDRLARERSKFADYDDLKAKAATAARLQQERETETEKAIREAKETAQQEAQSAVRPKLVAAEFRAAAAGRIDAARLATLTEDIDLSRYLTDAGEVDVERVTKKIDAWAPAPPEGEQQEQEQNQTTRQAGPRPDRSQGQQGTGKPSGVNAGRQMHEASRNRGATK